MRTITKTRVESLIAAINAKYGPNHIITRAQLNEIAETNPANFTNPAYLANMEKFRIGRNQYHFNGTVSKPSSDLPKKKAAASRRVKSSKTFKMSPNLKKLLKALSDINTNELQAMTGKN